jgi:hypothetical protein
MGSHTRSIEIGRVGTFELSTFPKAPTARNTKAWATGPGTTNNRKFEALKARNINIARLQRVE